MDLLRFREKHTPETECVPSQRVGVAAKCGMVGFYRLVFKISHVNEWEDSVQLLSCVVLFVTPWTAARQASLSITNSQSLPKLMSIELVMPSNYLILCRPLLLLLSIFLS